MAKAPIWPRTFKSIDLFDSMDRYNYNMDNKDGLAVIAKRPNVAGHGCHIAT
jgi:hypothetical protein